MLADIPGQKDRVFLILTGVWLFAALFLFGNPVILDYLHPPKSVILGGESPSNVLRYLGILVVLGLACVLGFSRLASQNCSCHRACPSGSPGCHLLGLAGRFSPFYKPQTKRCRSPR